MTKKQNTPSPVHADVLKKQIFDLVKIWASQAGCEVESLHDSRTEVNGKIYRSFKISLIGQG